MKNHNYYIYFITNKYNNVLYLGMTNNLIRRIYEHKNKMIDGFSKRYNLYKLVYYENISSVETAITREKEIKKWRREKKNKLIEAMNPEWKDLSEGLINA